VHGCQTNKRTKYSTSAHELGLVNDVQDGGALECLGKQAGDAQGNEAGCDGADDEEAEVFCDGQGEVEQADFVVLDMFI
jgi:hypothetical protein